MKASFVSNYGVAAARFQNINMMQRQLADLQVEISSGRHADQGLALGFRSFAPSCIFHLHLLGVFSAPSRTLQSPNRR